MLQEFRKRSASQQISKNIDQNKLEYIRSFAERLDNQDFRQTDSLLLDVQEELIRMHHKNEVLIRSALNKNIKWHFNVYGKLKETSFFLFFYASHTTPNRSDWKKNTNIFNYLGCKITSRTEWDWKSKTTKITGWRRPIEAPQSYPSTETIWLSMEIVPCNHRLVEAI